MCGDHRVAGLAMHRRRYSHDVRRFVHADEPARRRRVVRVNVQRDLTAARNAAIMGICKSRTGLMLSAPGSPIT